MCIGHDDMMTVLIVLNPILHALNDVWNLYRVDPRSKNLESTPG